MLKTNVCSKVKVLEKKLKNLLLEKKPQRN